MQDIMRVNREAVEIENRGIFLTKQLRQGMFLEKNVTGDGVIALDDGIIAKIECLSLTK